MKNGAKHGNRFRLKKRLLAAWTSEPSVIKILCAILLALNLLLLYGIFLSSEGVMNYRGHRRQVRQLKAEIVEIKRENQKLYEAIRDFRTNPETQEKVIREQLGLARPNELVIEFLPQAEKPGDSR